MGRRVGRANVCVDGSKDRLYADRFFSSSFSSVRAPSVTSGCSQASGWLRRFASNLQLLILAMMMMSTMFCVFIFDISALM